MTARLSKRSRINKYLLFAGLFISAVAAILSKENAVTLPLAILLVELFLIQTKKISINFKDYPVYLVIAGFATVIFIGLHKFSFHVFDPLPADDHNDFRVITSTNYLLTQFSVIPKYILLLIYPVNQNLDYDFPVSNSFFEIRTIFGFLFLLSLIGLAIFLYNKNRIFSFGILWFFLTLAVESSVIPISDVIFEHRTYLPSFGFFLIVSSVIYFFLWNKYKNTAIAILLLIIISNSYMTYARNKDWKDQLTLWNDIVSKSPNKARPYNYRAVQYNIQNKLPEAIRDYKKCIQLNPRWLEAYSNLGNLLTVINDTNEAMHYLTKAIELDSTYALAYNNRGDVFTREKKFEEAYKDYSAAIKYKSDFAEAYSNRGNLMTKQDKFDEAMKDLNKSIELNSFNPHAFLNRGCLLSNFKKRKEALEDMNKAIELQKDYSEAYFNRGIVYLNLNNKVKACLDLKKAMNLGNHPAAEMYKQYCQ
jgi:tetratricopeptide (TPR) repeat protein